MGSPLDGADVYAFFVHVPQRAEVAQFADVQSDGGDGIVDFLFGGKTSHGHAQTAVRQFVTAAQCTKHIAGLQTG